jgi:outer membrane protein assembly factor BamD
MEKLRSGLALVALVVPFALAGCQSKDGKIDYASYVEELEPADVLYNQGLANLKAGRLGEASKKFASIDRQHPYSEYARKAMVMGAFTNYRQGNYDEAILTSKRYVTLYPTTEEAAYAQYIVGLSYTKQISDVTRDQKESALAIQAFQDVIDRFPESEYVDDAQQNLRFARDQLAGKEMQIGRYYQERREYIAAIKRFRNVVEQYANTRHVEEALARLTETYLAMGIVGEAQTAAAVLGHNFPDSQWYADSYKLLASGGLEPRESRGSWLVDAGKKIIGAG